jgi:small nuclear ribonucleoprotein (snRNP)-like protein
MFPCARFKDDLVLAVGGSQLPCNILRAIWAVVVDDNHLPGEVTILLHHTSAVPALARGTPRSRSKLTHAPFAENFGEKPYDDREVFALFVSGEDYGVLVSTMLALHGVALERVHCRLVNCGSVFSNLMRDTEAIRNLKSILRGTLRIITQDDRAFVGTFVGTDKSLNILLVNTEEYRFDPGENTDGRYVGQVMVPWRLIQSIGLQVTSDSNVGAYAEQVRIPFSPALHRPCIPERNNAAICSVKLQCT